MVKQYGNYWLNPSDVCAIKPLRENEWLVYVGNVYTIPFAILDNAEIMRLVADLQCAESPVKEAK